MTKFQYTHVAGNPSPPLDYPTLGFIVTADGAILDGTASTPAITLPPDPSWAVYGGGSAETSITRYANPIVDPAPETTNGFLLAYSNSQNTYVPTAPASVIQNDAWSTALSAATAAQILPPNAVNPLTGWYHADRFGATGDGATNDTAAIDALLAAVPAGGTIYFPPGRYMTNGGHTISTPSVKLVGPSGRAQTYNSSAQFYLRNGANADMLTVANNQVTIRDLALYGNKSNQSSTSRGLVVHDGCNYLLLDAVWVDSFNGDAMVFGQTTGTLSATVTNCEARSSNGYGMKFVSGSTDTLVGRCYIDQNVQSGVFCSAGDISFTECHVWGNGTGASGDLDGFTFQSSSGCRLVNCYIESNTNGAGIRYKSGTLSNHKVIGCDIWNNGFQGIYAFGVSHLTLLGNEIRQNNFKGQASSAGAGALFDTVTDSLVSGNHFYGPSPFRQTYAYYENNACSGIIFTENNARADTHGTGDIVLSTTGAIPTIVRNNVMTSSLDTGNATSRVFATSDTVLNAATGLATVLSLPIKAGYKYLVRANVYIDGAQAADAKFRVQATSSTGASGWFGMGGVPAASNTSTTAANMNPSNAALIAASGGNSVVAGLLGVGVAQVVQFTGYVVGGSADGTLALQYAQNTSDATDTTLHTGSWLELVRVA